MRTPRLTLGGAVAFFALLAGPLVPAPSLAQDAMGNVAIGVIVQPLPGHSQAFEQGVQEHMANLMGMGDTSTWMVFEIAAGERTGQYMVASFNHTWDYFDQPPTVDQEAAEESMQDNIAPHVGGVQTQWMVRRDELGQWTPDSPVAPMYEVITFQIQGGMDAAFANVLAKLKRANQETGRGAAYSVFRPRIGGMGSQWVISVPHQSFAEFGQGPDDWMPRLLTEVYGHAEMESIMEDLGDSIISVKSELFVVRPDLSMNVPSS